MSDFLNNIVARTLNVAEVVQPRVPTLFEPLAGEQLESTIQTQHAHSNASSLETEKSEIESASETQSNQLKHGHPLIDPTEDRTRNRQVGHNFSQSRRVVMDKGDTNVASENMLEGSALNVKPADQLGQISAPVETSALQGGPLQRHPQVFDLETLSRGPKEPTVEFTQETFSDSESSASNLRHTVNAITNSTGRFPARAISSSARTPNVKIVIGRVDVRAVMPQSVTTAPPTPRPKPGLSLEDYLRQREEGKR
jgi:hypothetical protein